MNLGFMVAGIFVANLIVPAYALSLKLSPEVDLLVVDGRQVSGPILKGADSLELDTGQHQILFQISKNWATSASSANTSTSSVYHSPPIIVAFNAKKLQSVKISLPRLTNAQEGRDFSKKMNIALIDENGNQVDYRQDKLSGIRINNDQNYEAAVTQYNLSGHQASVPAFALAKKSTIPLNPNRAKSGQVIEVENSSTYLSFPLWSLLHQRSAIDSTAKWFSAQLSDMYHE